jgi:mono/diheme cytochrome c family protein
MKLLNTTILLIIMPFTSAWAAGEHQGGHGGHDQMHWMSPQEAQNRPNQVTMSAHSVQQGRQIFEKNCVSCHGQNAEGDGPAAAAINPRPTNLKAMSGNHPDGDFAWKIANGRGAMPAWKDTLSSEQIWHLVNYIQSLGGANNSMHGDHASHQHDN